MDRLLQGLRAAAGPSRLRLLALCAHGELTVSDLTQILGQSQPRVSRHLKLLVEAGLLDRYREGTWAFYRLSENGACADLARTLVDLVPADDPTQGRDLERLEAVRAARGAVAAEYFRRHAPQWDKVRRSEEHTAELQSLMRISYAVFCLKQKHEYYNTKIN